MPGRTVLQWDKDDCADAGLVKFDLLGPRHALRAQVRLPVHPRDRWHGRGRLWAPRPPARRPRRLRPPVRRGHRWRVPGRVARADGDAAAPAAAQVLRHRRRGGAHPPRPHPGRLRAPVHQPRARPRGDHLPAPAAREVPRQDPGRAAVPGAAHADGDGLRGLRRLARGPAAPRHGLQALPRTHGGAARALHGGRQRQRHHRGHRASDLRQAQGLQRLWLPRVPLVLLRVPRLRLELAQGAPARRLLRGAARRAAHGLLLAAIARRRCPTPRPGHPAAVRLALGGFGGGRTAR